MEHLPLDLLDKITRTFDLNEALMFSNTCMTLRRLLHKDINTTATKLKYYKCFKRLHTRLTSMGYNRITDYQCLKIFGPIK